MTTQNTNTALFLAWILALTGTLASLYLGEIAGMAICSLCWYQRIMMYPLAILLAIAAYRNDKSVIPYSLVLAFIGSALALYHYLLQKIPGMAPIIPCAAGHNCNEIQMQLFGFITLPFLSLINFIVIMIFLIAAYKKT